MALTGAPGAPRNAPPGPILSTRDRWFPGISDSVPLLMFGGLAIVLGLYLVLTHAPPFIGRLPLYAYLWTLGAIAIVGGLAASAVGQELDGLPGEGEAVGDDLIVVRRSDWEGHQEPETLEAAAPRPGRSVPVVVTPGSDSAGLPMARPNTPTELNWWDEAFDLLDSGSIAASVAAPEDETDEVLAALTRIERDSGLRRRPRPPPVAVRPAPPASSTLDRPTPSTVWPWSPRPASELDRSVDQQLDEIEQVLSRAPGAEWKGGSASGHRRSPVRRLPPPDVPGRKRAPLRFL